MDSHTWSKCSEFKHAGLFYTKNTLMQPPKSAFFSALRIQMNTDKDSICYLVSKLDLCLFQSIPSSSFLRLRVTGEFLLKTRFIQHLFTPVNDPLLLQCHAECQHSLHCCPAMEKATGRCLLQELQRDLLICPPHTDETLWRCRHFRSEGTHPSVSHFWIT